MVKRSRRMTVKKKKFSGVKKPKAVKKPTKGKKLVRSSKKRPASKTDRANQASKVLMKALKKQTGDNE